MKKVNDLKRGDKCWILHSDGTIEECTYVEKVYRCNQIYVVTFERRERGGGKRLYNTRLPEFGNATRFNHHRHITVFLNKEDLYGVINERIKNLKISKVEVLR